MVDVELIVALFLIFRSTATGAGVGDENVADTVKKVLPRREAEPQRAVYQSCRGESILVYSNYWYELLFVYKIYFYL